jgi:hypothetical protein
MNEARNDSASESRAARMNKSKTTQLQERACSCSYRAWRKTAMTCAMRGVRQLPQLSLHLCSYPLFVGCFCAFACPTSQHHHQDVTRDLAWFAAAPDHCRRSAHTQVQLAPQGRALGRCAALPGVCLHVAYTAGCCCRQQPLDLNDVCAALVSQHWGGILILVPAIVITGACGCPHTVPGCSNVDL